MVAHTLKAGGKVALQACLDTPLGDGPGAKHAAHVAVESGNHRLLKALVRNEAEVHTLTRNGGSALQAACQVPEGLQLFVSSCRHTCIYQQLTST